jgi:hypothetical protein
MSLFSLVNYKPMRAILLFTLLLLISYVFSQEQCGPTRCGEGEVCCELHPVLLLF